MFKPQNVNVLALCVTIYTMLIYTRVVPLNSRLYSFLIN